MEHVFGHGEILEARKKAIKAIVKHIDENYIAYRETLHGKTAVVKAPNKGIFSAYSHSTSRANDPQSHTHVLICNMVPRKEGGYRALYNDFIFKNQKELTAIYNAAMAKELSDLGFSIENKGRGFYEIAGIPREMLAQFSKRSEQILKAEEKFRENGILKHANEAELNRIATLETRYNKSNMTEAELKQSWGDQIKGLSLENEPSFVEMPVRDLSKTRDLSIDAYLKIAIEDITANESTFDSAKVNYECLSLAVGKYQLEDVQNSFRAAIESGMVEEIAPNIFSTPEMIQTEKEIINKLQEGAGRVKPIMTEKEALEYLANYESTSKRKLTAGQRDLFLAVMTSKDQYIITQGDAGTGKTTIFKAITEAAQSKNMEVSGFSKTGKAVQEFNSATGALSSTIDSFLAAESKRQADIRVIDEASMIGSRYMKSMLDRSEQDRSRMILIGDVKQLLAIDAGRAFKDSQQYSGLKIVSMTENVRQKTDYAKALVQSVKDKQIDSAFQIMQLAGKIYEEQYFEDRMLITKDLYLESENSIAIVTNNQERNTLNQIIRKELQQLGIIGKEDHAFLTREQMNMLESEKRHGHNYHGATHIHFQHPFAGFKAGSEAEIVRIDSDHNLMIVQDRNRVVEIDLIKHGSHIRAFKEAKRDFAVGEQIIFTKNDRMLGIQNGLSGKISSIDKKGIIHIKTNNGRSVKIDIDHYRYLDHGYAITDYKSQGSTYENVIFSGMAEMTNYNSFYVASSRTKSDFQLITNNIELFKERAVVELEKTSTLDHTLENDQPLLVGTGKSSEQNQSRKLEIDFKIADRAPEPQKENGPGIEI